MRCESRKPSVDFPGRDEIKLAEFADEAMTQFLGRGSWIDGIGTIHGVSCNNRFDRSMAQRQMFRIIDNGHVAWERSLASIDNVDAAPTLDARVIGRTVIASEPFTLYSIDGRRIASGEGSVEVAAPGIYIVATPSASAKVAVSL